MFNSPSPTNAPTPPLGGPVTLTSELGHLNHAQSLPATPTSTNVRTFTDFSAEHTRLTTLHGSTGALEVNNLGGFKLNPMAQQGNGSAASDRNKYSLELSIDGMVGGAGPHPMNRSSNGLSGGMFNGPNSHMTNGIGGAINGLAVNGRGPGSDHNVHAAYGQNFGPPKPVTDPPIHTSYSANSLHRHYVDNNPPPHSAGPLAPPIGNFGFTSDYDDEISDVFSGLSLRDPLLGAAPGYGRSRFRRSSAPVGMNGFVNGGPNGYGLWGNGGSDHQLPGLHEREDNENGGGGLTVPRSNSGQASGSNPSSGGSSNGSYGGGWGGVGPLGTLGSAVTSSQPQQTSPNTWFGSQSHPDSVTSGYSSSEQSSLSGFSPIYSPTASTGFGFTPTSRNSPVTVSSSSGLLTSCALPPEDRETTRSPFKVSESGRLA